MWGTGTADKEKTVMAVLFDANKNSALSTQVARLPVFDDKFAHGRALVLHALIPTVPTPWSASAFLSAALTFTSNTLQPQRRPFCLSTLTTHPVP